MEFKLESYLIFRLIVSFVFLTSALGLNDCSLISFRDPHVSRSYFKLVFISMSYTFLSIHMHNKKG